MEHLININLNVFHETSRLRNLISLKSKNREFKENRSFPLF